MGGHAGGGNARAPPFEGSGEVVAADSSSSQHATIIVAGKDFVCRDNPYKQKYFIESSDVCELLCKSLQCK